MLSILIPVYNYDISELVLEIHSQLSKTGLEFEILCRDDKSDKFSKRNKSIIESLAYSTYHQSGRNIGRTSSKQFLAEKAIYNWLLFLDADVLPKTNLFIENYLACTKLNYKAIFGGFTYPLQHQSEEGILRWKYGKKYEEVTSKKRNLKPHQLIISANFLINKEIFIIINSQINRKSYGLDNYFAALLKLNTINVLHIDNEVYHNGLEKNSTYIKKSEEAISTLLWMYNDKGIRDFDHKLLSFFIASKKIKLNYIFVITYNIFGNLILKNLKSKSPNTSLLQVYKLLYISYKDFKQ